MVFFLVTTNWHFNINFKITLEIVVKRYKILFLKAVAYQTSECVPISAVKGSSEWMSIHSFTCSFILIHSFTCNELFPLRYLSPCLIGWKNAGAISGLIQIYCIIN